MQDDSIPEFFGLCGGNGGNRRMQAMVLQHAVCRLKIERQKRGSEDQNTKDKAQRTELFFSYHTIGVMNFP